MGLIGINTEGKFVVSVYENNSKNRSAVLGVKYGDYAFDSSDNSYKKILTKKSFGTARVISEDELEVIDNPNLVTFYFTESQFEYSGFSSAELLSVIYFGEDEENESLNYIDKLNSLLEQRTLIKQIVEKYDFTLPVEIEKLDFNSLSTEEIASLNRFFLSEYFPEYCPPVDFSNNAVSDVFPLLSLLLPKGDITENIVNRAVSYDDYVKERNSIKNEMNSYCKFDFLDYYEKEKELKLIAKIGIYGKYSISWSNIEGSIAAICFVQAETELNLNKVITGSLLGEPIEFLNITKDIMIGYIPLSIGLTGSFDLNYKAEASLSVNSNLFAGYTGMYGGKITVGANYGTRWEEWFKIWQTWFYKLKIYIDPYANGEIISKTAYFIGFQDNATSLFNVQGTLSASITPNVIITPKVGLCHNAVWIGVAAENGVNLGITVSSDLKNYSGNAYVDLYLKLNGSGGIDITIPVINKGLKKEFSVFSVTPVNYRVADWKVF